MQFMFPATLEFRSVQILIEAEDMREALAKFDGGEFDYTIQTGEMVNWDRTGPVEADDGSQTFECEELDS